MSNAERAADFNELYEGRRPGEIASEHLARLDRILSAAEERGRVQGYAEGYKAGYADRMAERDYDPYAEYGKSEDT